MNMSTNVNEHRYTIREEGRNGTVALHGTRLVRTVRRRLGRDDIQTIPVSSVSHVELDRKMLGADTLHVHVGTMTFDWKTAQAEELQARILDAKEQVVGA